MNYLSHSDVNHLSTWHLLFVFLPQCACPMGVYIFAECEVMLEKCNEKHFMSWHIKTCFYIRTCIFYIRAVVKRMFLSGFVCFFLIIFFLCPLLITGSEHRETGTKTDSILSQWLHPFCLIWYLFGNHETNSPIPFSCTQSIHPFQMNSDELVQIECRVRYKYTTWTGRYNLLQDLLWNELYNTSKSTFELQSSLSCQVCWPMMHFHFTTKFHSTSKVVFLGAFSVQMPQCLRGVWDRSVTSPGLIFTSDGRIRK